MKVEFYIPSKGRPECRSYHLLREQEIDPYVVVEPQDQEAYQAALPHARFLILPENDQGLAYVRNYIRDHAQLNELDWFFQVDDDIINFYKKVGNKTSVTHLPFLPDFIQTLEQAPDKVGAIGLEYNQFAWSARKPAINSYIDVFSGFRTKAMATVKFDKDMELKLDRDIVLQLLSNGWKTIRFPDYAFSCPSMGTNKGGLYDEYRSQKLLQGCQNMIFKWGTDICQMDLTNPDRPDVKINWKHFK